MHIIYSASVSASPGKTGKPGAGKKTKVQPPTEGQKDGQLKKGKP